MNSAPNMFKPLAGLYVFWQGVELLRSMSDGEGPFGTVGTVLLGVLFLGFGAWCVVSYYREYKAYKEQQKAEKTEKADEPAKIEDAQ